MKTEREFNPGQAPVYPGEGLPRREPWGSFSTWGAPPPSATDRPGAYERPWDSPGSPPWVASRPSGPPTWAVVCILVGSPMVLVALVWMLILIAG
jgi:hypothetical protein